MSTPLEKGLQTGVFILAANFVRFIRTAESLNWIWIMPWGGFRSTKSFTFAWNLVPLHLRREICLECNLHLNAAAAVAATDADGHDAASMSVTAVNISENLLILVLPTLPCARSFKTHYKSGACLDLWSMDRFPTFRVNLRSHHFFLLTH